MPAERKRQSRNGSLKDSPSSRKVRVQSPKQITATARYFLYSHWGVGDRQDDIERWVEADQSRAWVKEQPVCRYLVGARVELARFLKASRGFLVLFFDPGWKLALKPLLTETEEKQLSLASSYANTVASFIEGALGTERVRILTAGDLREFIRELREREKPEIYRWFVGEKGVGTYDSPKIVEAFLRVRALGTGIPVFRVDWDVLVNVCGGRDKTVLGVNEGAVNKSLKKDESAREEVNIRTWVFSAGYRLPVDSSYESWSRGFATRIQPALLATPEMCQLVCGWNFGLLKEKIGKPPSPLGVNDVIEGSFNLKMAEAFLGVRKQKRGWAIHPNKPSIANLGADPLKGVISGALLNLSASAILDLPPFSNMTRGVMWIDDHLKFKLHEALGHLPRNAQETCRVQAEVVKGRIRPEINLAAYTWASYLPTLLLGLVMDAWIRSGKRPLVEALKKAIKSGVCDLRTAFNLEKQLRDSAISRISEVHVWWLGLRSENTHTLASAWASSEVEPLIKAQYPGIEVNLESRGLGLVDSSTRPRILAIDHLRGPIQQELRELIWDAIDYIHLTLHWPGMIQTIRAVERGLLRLKGRSGVPEGLV